MPGPIAGDGPGARKRSSPRHRPVALEEHNGRGDPRAAPVDGRRPLGVSARRRRFLLCATPAQGHTAPLLALSRRLVEDDHEVLCFTTEHYRDKVTATGARFAPFGAAYDAHDLMVANPEREASSARGVRGVKDDLRRIFVGPLVGQHADLMALLATFPADVIVIDPMFFGALPLALGAREDRPALAVIGVMPLTVCSRDTAPFGAALQPGTGPLHRLRNVAMNWATEHVVMADIQRLARRCLAECGSPPFPGYLIDLQPRVVDAFLQGTVESFEYPRSDLPASIRFVGPIVAPPPTRFASPDWWDDLAAARPVVHVTQGTLDNADLGRLLVPTMTALAHDDVLVVATTGGPDPAPSAPPYRPTPAWSGSSPTTSCTAPGRRHGHQRRLHGSGVQQALAHGVPLVVAGDSEDKPEVAARVQWSGAGLNLRRAATRPRTQLATCRTTHPGPPLLPPAGGDPPGRDRGHRPRRHHRRDPGRPGRVRAGLAVQPLRRQPLGRQPLSGDMSA